MKWLYNGFYKELERLMEEYDDASFCFLENIEAVTKDYNKKIYASDFLYGFCDIFATCLRKEFGYETYAIYDENKRLIHAYCVHKSKKNSICFIDVRGCTNDFSKFIKEFNDFITVTDGEPLDICTYKPNFSYSQYADAAINISELPIV